jgi:hypothetical protein
MPGNELLPNVVGHSRMGTDADVPAHSSYRGAEDDQICVKVPLTTPRNDSRCFGLTVPLTFWDRIRIMLGRDPFVDVMLLGPGAAGAPDRKHGAVIVVLGGCR